MSKRKRNYNTHGKGGRVDFKPLNGKKSDRLRPVTHVDRSDTFYLWLLALTFACISVAFVLK